MSPTSTAEGKLETGSTFVAKVVEVKGIKILSTVFVNSDDILYGADHDRCRSIRVFRTNGMPDECKVGDEVLCEVVDILPLGNPLKVSKDNRTFIYFNVKPLSRVVSKNMRLREFDIVEEHVCGDNRYEAVVIGPVRTRKTWFLTDDGRAIRGLELYRDHSDGPELVAVQKSSLFPVTKEEFIEQELKGLEASLSIQSAARRFNTFKPMTHTVPEIGCKEWGSSACF